LNGLFGGDRLPRMIRMVPNILTLGRLVGTVGLLAMVLYSPRIAEEVRWKWLDAAFVLFVVSSLTDIIDGKIARKYNVTSRFGRMLDPLVDKILVCGAFISFALIGQPRLFDWGDTTQRVIHWSVVGIVIGRDAYVTVLRHIAEARGVDFSAVLSGKLKMFLQIFAIGTIMVKMAHVQTAVWGYWFTSVTLIAMVAATVVSGLTYQMRWIRATSRPDRRPTGSSVRTRRHHSLRKEYLFGALMGDGEGPVWRLGAFVLLVCALPYLCAAFDGSFFLPGEALGLLEHYGNVSFTVLCPLALFFVVRGIYRFDQFIANVRTNLKREVLQDSTGLKSLLECNWIRDPARGVKFLFIAVGMAFATANAAWAVRPEAVWGHDVYDSIHFTWGYVGQRVFYYIWWGYILPVCAYRLLVICIVLRRVFRFVASTDSLDLQPMHPDKAAGLGQLGAMAWNFNVAAFLTMGISVALYYSHGFTTPLLCGVSLQVALLPGVFFLPLLPVHRAMKSERESILLSISTQYKRVSDALVDKIAAGPDAATGRLVAVRNEYDEEARLRALYRSLESIPSWPFDVRTVLQFASTLLPAVLWLVKIVVFRDHSH